MTREKTTLLIVTILFLGAMLRLFGLDRYPPALNWDEVSHGYNSYSILQTGKDEWGQTLPVVNFRAYGDYPLPLNLYVTMPFVAFLGLNAFSIRLPHAALGVLTILASYFLAYGITKRKDVSLLTMFLVAIEPWYLFTSRFVAQSNLSVFLLTSAFAAFFNRRKYKALLPISFIFMGLTLFSYHSTRIFTPMILIVALLIYKEELVAGIKEKSRVWILSLVIIFIFFLPLPFILLMPEARARAGEVFLVDAGSISEIIEQRAISVFPESITRLVYNRPVWFVQSFIENYKGYFSPSYLFINGGTNYQFSVPGMGLMYLVGMPFFYIGLFKVLSKALARNKSYVMILSWLILAPIAASITKEQYAVLRSTPMLPIPQLLTAVGVFFSIDWACRRFKLSKMRAVLLSVYLSLLVLSLGLYLQSYTKNYRVDYSWAWQYGYEQVIDYAKDSYDNYDKIIVTKKYAEPHEFFLFYNEWDPESFRNDANLIRFNQSNWYWVDAFDKYYFVNDWQINEEGTGNYEFILESDNTVHCSPITDHCLLITSPDNVPDGWSKLDSIKFLDGKTAFEIYDNY